MTWRNTQTTWGGLAKILHWLVAIGIAALIYYGLLQSDLPRGTEKTAIRATHASIALIVFVLMVVRLGWRFISPPPGHPPGLPRWQALAATLVHAALYVAVFVQLVSGAMTVATNGTPLPFFGLFGIPLPVAESHDAHEFWEEIHEPAWIAIAVLVTVHVAGALYNHFVRRNDVLRRMTTGGGDRHA